jgi:hypothetical protein
MKWGALPMTMKNEVGQLFFKQDLENESYLGREVPVGHHTDHKGHLLDTSGLLRMDLQLDSTLRPSFRREYKMLVGRFLRSRQLQGLPHKELHLQTISRYMYP